MREGLQTPSSASPTVAERVTRTPVSNGITTPASRNFAEYAKRVNRLAELLCNATNKPIQIDQYEVLDQIGEGGQAFVLRGWDLKLERQVALKIPHLHKLTDQKVIERLIREAQSISQLVDHPHIVPIYAAGEFNELPYLVFGFCPDGNLAQWLHNNGPTVPPRTAVSWLCQLAQAVQHAHEHDILHRDIKPNNVYLQQRADYTSDDQGLTLKLGDFGLAKFMDADNDGDGCTMTHDRLGTPGYMAPEQLSGQHHLLSPATDIYALGALLFELLTGTVPYTKATAPWQGIGELPSLRQACPAASHELEAICHKCLATDPGQRYASAAALHADLQCYLNGEPTSVRPDTLWSSAWRYLKKNKMQFALVGCILALIMTVLVLALREDSTLPDPMPVKADCNEVWTGVSSLDGTLLLVAGDTDSGNPLVPSIERVSIFDVAKRQLLRSFPTKHIAMIKKMAVVDNGANLITASYDGSVREYQWMTGKESFKQPVIQLPPVKVGNQMQDRSILSMTLSRDEQWIAVSSKDYDKSPTMIVVHHRKTGREYQLLNALHCQIIQLLFPEESDPTHLLFIASTHNELLRWNFKDAKANPIWKCDSGIHAIAFSPQSQRIALALANHEIRIIAWPGMRELPRLQGHQHEIRRLAYSPNGQWLVSVDIEGNVFWWDLTKDQGRASVRYYRNIQINALAFSPDGRWLAIGYHNGNVEIFPTSSIPR